MGLKLDHLQVYPIFEEHCTANQIIAQLKVIRDDGIQPHIRYKKYESSEEVYKYITVNDTNGNVYLTIDGVNAINEDHADPSKDIEELTFKVVANDYEEGDSLIVDVNVKVVRVHDEPPKIIEDIVYDLYQDDAKEGKILIDLRTLYPANFFIVNDYDYFHFLINDFGRLTLTNAGVTYIKNLNIDETNSIDIKIEIKDKFNKKVIYKTYTLPIKKGSAIQTVPKKSILEQIAQYLGQDLSEKIEDLRLTSEDLKFKTDYVFNEFFDLDGPILNSFDGKALLNYSVGNEKVKNGTTEYDFLYNNDFITLLSNDNTIIFKKTIGNIIDAIKDPLNYNQQELLNNSQILSLINLKSKDNDTITFNPTENLNNFFKSIKRQMDNRISHILSDIINPTIENIRGEYWSEFERIEKDFLQFKLYDSKVIFQKIMTQVFNLEHLLKDKTWTEIKDYNGKKQSKNDSDAYGLIGKVFDNEMRLDKLEYLDNHKAATFTENRTIVYQNLISSNDDDKAKEGLLGIVYDIDHRDLEDWSKNRKNSNGWAFRENTDGSSALLRGYHEILNISGGLTSLKSQDAINLNVSGDITRFDGTTLSVKGGEGIVKAKTFTGTANKAKYADLAEYYEPDDCYEPGTLLMIGGDKEVTKFKFNEGPYIGPVSSKPGFILNSDKEEKNWILLALRGRVNIKIEKGLSIEKGQSLFASEKQDGVAGIKPNNYFVGYSLQDFDSSEYTESNNSILAII